MRGAGDKIQGEGETGPQTSDLIPDPWPPEATYRLRHRHL